MEDGNFDLGEVRIGLIFRMGIQSITLVSHLGKCTDYRVQGMFEVQTTGHNHSA